MPHSRLTGTRIRERRLFLGQKQAALAKAVGISAAYLNLIEHNRRRIGGKLLQDLARELSTDPMTLAEGAEAALLGTLREAGQRLPDTSPELNRAEDLAGRFPGWAALVAAQHNRIRDLEELVEALSDRLTHDPELAASLHEVISAVTAIRSTVGILSGGGDVDPDWQNRFLRNMSEEGRRLAGATQGLVEYLDAGADQDMAPVGPGEELSAFLEARDYHLPELEEAAASGDLAVEVQNLVTEVSAQELPEARMLAQHHLSQYAQAAQSMPLDAFVDAGRACEWDLSDIAERFEQPLDVVMRRLAFLPPDMDAPTCGLVSCDGAGALILRKALPGFPLPRFGAACAFWPLYQALSHPGRPQVSLVEQPGPTPRRFLCHAISRPRKALRFDQPPVMEATMLITPEEDAPKNPGPVLPVGSSCRVCPRRKCAARREASILASSV